MTVDVYFAVDDQLEAVAIGVESIRGCMNAILDRKAVVAFLSNGRTLNVFDHIVSG